MIFQTPTSICFYLEGYGESLCLYNKHCVVWKQRIEIWIRDGTLWKLRSLAYCWRPCPCLPRNICWVHLTKGVKSVKSCLYYTILYQRNTATTSRQEKTIHTCPLNQFKGQRPKHSEQSLDYTRLGLGASSSLDCCMAMRCHRSATMCDHMFSVS